MLTLLLLLVAIHPLPRRPRSVAASPPFPVRVTLSVHAAEGDATTEILPHAAVGSRPAAVVRPIAALKSGETPRIRWRVASLDAKNIVTHLVVHLLIRKADDVDAPIPEAFQEGPILDTVLGTDLAPRGSTDGEIATALYGAGVYLVEIELRDDTGARRQYAAIDLKVAE